MHMRDVPPLLPVPEGLSVIETIALVPLPHIGSFVAHAMLYHPYAWVERLPTKTDPERLATARECAEFMISKGEIPPMTDDFLTEWINRDMLRQVSNHGVVRVSHLDSEKGESACGALLERVTEGVIAEHGNSRDFSHLGIILN